jgi:type III restriction enzyme
MNFQLKDYQKKTIGSADQKGALDSFLELARGAQNDRELHVAFNQARRLAMGEALRDMPYRPLVAEGELNKVPQVCIRIPTGGGKTLLAAYAIERAARLYVGNRFPVVLWMVPSDAIRSQTRDALRTPGHPYNDALLQYWPADRLSVMDISDCEQIRAQDFGNRTLIIVCTMQTLRVGNTSKRNVYAYKETFEPHFSGLGEPDFFERVKQEDLDEQPYLKQLLGASAIGKVKYSFANLLAWHRPIVIVDEAHNSTTNLSNEVFQRIRPSCIIEWTATPARDQNVLYHVSAQELKAENMVKLPIVLAPHPNWQEAVRDAVLTRTRLAEAAMGEDDYIRPIILFQAQPKNEEVTVEVLKAHLIAELHIPESQIAIATGNQRELEGINLFERTCPINFVITVEALKEGWDCSFAYVFCSMQNIRSAKDMEQLLGRVLRLPYAKARRSPELARAYAHVCAASTASVANQLADKLVAMGYEEMEIPQLIQPVGGLFAEPEQPQATVPASAIEVSEEVAKAITTLNDAAITVSPSDQQGKSSAIITGLLPIATVEALVAAVPKKEQEQVRNLLDRHQASVQTRLSPAQRGEDFGTLPQLVVSIQGEMELLESALLSELTEVSLASASPELPDFSEQSDKKPYLIDIENGGLRISEDRAQYNLDLNAGNEAIRREDVIRTLDRKVRRDDILQPDMIAWLGRVLDNLEQRGISLTYCARHINQLAEAVGKRIDQFAQSERKQLFQQSLLDGPAKARLSDHHHFCFNREIYPARWTFNGRYNFAKHYYARPGELDDDLNQAETACAIEIDSLPEVQYWVRNLERQPQYSFWLPTSTDRFYPDFVARLADGRLLVIEYKGGHLWSNEDSREKRDIGKVWAAASNGSCLFAMITEASIAGMSVGAQLRTALVTN